MEKLRAWLLANRASVRMAFILRIVGMGVGSLASLLFTRLLLRAMGDALNGLFLSFLAVAGLGGLGDLGVSAAVAVRAGQMLGRKEDDALRSYLASARSLVVVLALAVCCVFVALSPWLPQWLHFKQVAGAGSLTLLFVYAGVSAALLILAGYIHSLNFAYGTVTWPILPTVLICQISAPFFHWLLARQGLPLWAQMLPYAATSLVNAWLCWRMLKWAHPWLGNLRPVVFEHRIWGDLATASVWSFICSVGTAIYRSTDRVVINAGFGSAAVPAYQYNYKLCELATMLIMTASFVSVPKITQWLASSEAADQERARTESTRLNMFQALFGCAAALVYLGLNDGFIGIWLGTRYQAPLFLQLAFAWNLVVTTSGDAAIMMTLRLGRDGLKIGGLAVAAAGVLNLALSIAATMAGWIAGVAVATAIAQSALVVFCSVRTCRHLGVPATHWLARCWLVPLAVVTAGYFVRRAFPPDGAAHVAMLATTFTAMLAAVAWIIGMRPKMLADEWRVLRGMVK